MTIVMAVVPLLLLIVAGLSVGIVLVLAEQSRILKQQVEIRNKKIGPEAASRRKRVTPSARSVARRAASTGCTPGRTGLALQIHEFAAAAARLPQRRLRILRGVRAREGRRARSSASRQDGPSIDWGTCSVAWGKLAEGERGYRQAIDALENRSVRRTHRTWSDSKTLRQPLRTGRASR